MVLLLNHQTLLMTLTQKKVAKGWQRCIKNAKCLHYLPLLDDLIKCIIVACMCNTLCAFYQHKSKERIYMVWNSFFEYKRGSTYTINTHVNKVVSMGNLLKDLGQPIPQELLIIKILYDSPSNRTTLLQHGQMFPCYNGLRKCQSHTSSNGDTHEFVSILYF